MTEFAAESNPASGGGDADGKERLVRRQTTGQEQTDRQPRRRQLSRQHRGQLLHVVLEERFFRHGQRYNGGNPHLGLKGGTLAQANQRNRGQRKEGMQQGYSQE